MKTKAAVLYEANSPLVMEELDLDPPKAGEVLVKIGAAGICRSDWHYMAGESFMPLPAVLGHEGSGIVQEIGPGVTSLKPGDPVILSFVSRCGRCHFCTIGRPNLCDAHMATSTTMLDGTYRLHKGETNITPMSKLACFSQYSVVPEAACVPCPKELPLDKAAVIGCCVTTGVGAAVNARWSPGQPSRWWAAAAWVSTSSWGGGPPNHCRGHQRRCQGGAGGDGGRLHLRGIRGLRRRGVGSTSSWERGWPAPAKSLPWTPAKERWSTRPTKTSTGAKCHAVRRNPRRQPRPAERPGEGEGDYRAGDNRATLMTVRVRRCIRVYRRDHSLHLRVQQET